MITTEHIMYYVATTKLDAFDAFTKYMNRGHSEKVGELLIPLELKQLFANSV